MTGYPPYVYAYGKLNELFQKIKEAGVPPKFTNDFLYTKLGLKSTSYRPMIPLLRRLGFIDDASVPTVRYRDYRDPNKSKIILAQALKEAYKDLFAANEYAQNLTEKQVEEKLSSVLGTPKDDEVVPRIANTFLALSKLAEFERKIVEPRKKVTDAEKPKVTSELVSMQLPATKLGISYTINLNLPATNDIEVFNAIFKALKENLLR